MGVIWRQSLVQKDFMMVVPAAGEAFAWWRDLGVADAQLRRAFRLDARSFRRWRRGDHSLQNEGQPKLDDLESLRIHLLETFTTVAAARTWLHASSRYLGGRTPVETLEAGQFDRVEAALNALDLGVFV